jgi:CheY-like chemotaxis protein/HPt (histidine-containing phosphotransfer) domain-containing protein
VVVDIANNGVEGVQMALAGRYALVLMDIQMPEMDGLEAARRIRATPGFADLPIVAMTANAMASDHQRSIDAGMNAHITKPIDKNLLTQTLLQWIAHRTVGTDGTDSTESTQPAYSAPAPPTADRPIDVDAAAQRLGGSRDFFATIAKAFGTDAAAQLAALRQQLDANDQAGALRSVHTFKGLAATVGANALAQLAAQTEDELKSRGSEAGSGVAQTYHLLEALGAQFVGVLDELRALAPPMDPAPITAPSRPAAAAPPWTPEDAQAHRDSMRTLRGLLQSGDMQACALCESMRLAYAAHPDARFGLLAEAVSRLDFAQALVHCNDLLRALETA